METVRMAKPRPRKNQSESSDFPCHIKISIITYYNLSTSTDDIPFIDIQRTLSVSRIREHRVTLGNIGSHDVLIFDGS